MLYTSSRTRKSAIRLGLAGDSVRNKHPALAKLCATAVVAVAVTLALDVSAQNWPVRAARIVVPFQPGGGADTQARILGKKFYESMGQTFVVDNRSGAGGMIGAE